MGRILVTFVIAILFLFGALYAAQRKLLYFPTQTSEDEALRAARASGMAPWRDGQGRLLGWRLVNPPAQPRAVVLVLHGNAGSALDRAHYARALGSLGIDVALLEYPGYGPRPGRPSLAALVGAALEAVDALAREQPVVWLLGESLGSGVAGRVANVRPSTVRGLLLITPFADLGAVARHHYPVIPTWFVRDRFQPARDLAEFRKPVVVVIAGRDEVVGADESRRLAAALPGPKQIIEQPSATHNSLDLSMRSFWASAVHFLEQN
jgi:alpha-beta hydrolase superfamily lysophospholipase